MELLAKLSPKLIKPIRQTQCSGLRAVGISYQGHRVFIGATDMGKDLERSNGFM